MIYTAITGNYDKPRRGLRVFTEYDRFKDNRLNAKIYKCLPHMFLPDASWWVWIDGNLELKGWMPTRKLHEMMDGSDVAVFSNPYRDTVKEEKEEILRLELDTEENVNFHKLDDKAKLPACFLILRKNTPEVRRMNEHWWALICTGSVRDQISFARAYPCAKYFPKVHPFDNKFFTRHGHERPRPIQKAGQKD